MKKYIYVSGFAGIIAFLFFFIQNPKLPIEQYAIDTLISDIEGDSLGFFNSPNSLSYFNGKLAISDKKNYRICILDTNLNFINSFGNKGLGPSEIMYPYHIVYKNEIIHVADSWQNKIIIFNVNGKYSKSISFPKLNSTSNFIVTNRETILMPNYNSLSRNSLFDEFNENGSLVKECGTKIDFFDPIQKMKTNKIILNQDKEENIYVTFITYPLIQKYNKDGNLIWGKDLNKIKQLKKIIKKVKKYNKENIKGTLSLAISSAINKNQLIVVFSNIILAFDINNGDLLSQIKIMKHENQNFALFNLTYIDNKLYFLDESANVIAKCSKVGN